jgi:predicted ATP-grasp superfamily ATP-dependent carboligase
MTLLFPPQEVFRKATHKELTLACASRIGIPIPATQYPQSIEDVEICRNMRFPVVLKMAHHEFPPGTKVFRHKALRLENLEALRQVLGKLPPGQFPMVQEFIPGHGVGMSMLIRNGKTVLAFQHRRLRESPPEGGVSVFCESMPLDPQLLRQSEQLLGEMGWEGVAMVEYRGDPAIGRYALMEVNGRFWGSLPAAVHAGANFPFLLYSTSITQALPGSLPDYRVGLRARSLAGDTKWLWSVLRSRTRPPIPAIAEYLAGFHPAVRYFIWASDDPKPAIMNFLDRFWRHR